MCENVKIDLYSINSSKNCTLGMYVMSYVVPNVHILEIQFAFQRSSPTEMKRVLKCMKKLLKAQEFFTSIKLIVCGYFKSFLDRLFVTRQFMFMNKIGSYIQKIIRFFFYRTFAFSLKINSINFQMPCLDKKYIRFFIILHCVTIIQRTTHMLA